MQDSVPNFLANIKLSQLELRDFRQFDNLTVPFDNQLTAFIGTNGSGKTTILEAVAGALLDFNAHLHHFRNEPFFAVKDLRITDKGVKEDFDLELQFTDIPKMSLNYNKKSLYTTFYWDTTNEWQPTDDDNNKFTKLNNWTTAAFTANTNVPVFAYYACGRIGNQQPLPNKELGVHDLSPLRTYENALNAHSLNFETLENWLKWKYNQLITATKKKKDPLFESIKEVIVGKNGILNMDDERRFDDLRVNYDSPKGNLVLVKGKKQLFEYQLSSGEKSLLVLFADIARRCVIANPFSDQPLETASGIVLIDEIDLHLHPSWQRTVATKLRAIFPNLQFMVTTHSPTMLSEIASVHIRTIENKKIYGVRETLGHADEEMLDIMGATSERKIKIREIHRLLAQNKILEAKEIRAKINVEGVSAPLLEIDLYIKRKEKVVI